MIIGKLKQYCDKCGGEIEHNFYHTIEWEDLYAHTQERKHKRAEVCNKCYEKAFHYFFQCGSGVKYSHIIPPDGEVNEEVSTEDVYYRAARSITNEVL